MARRRLSLGGGGGGGGGGDGGGHVPTIVIDSGAKHMHSSNRDLMGVMDDMHLGGDDGRGGGGAYGDEDEDDLLGLMDSAQDR